MGRPRVPPGPTDAGGASIRQGSDHPRGSSVLVPPAGPPTTGPEVQDRDWVRSPVDRWILAGLEQGAAPGPAGGPPDPDPPRHVRPDRTAADPEDVDAFLADTSPSLRQGRRSVAGLAGLRRAVGSALARCRPLRGHRRQTRRLPRAARRTSIATMSSRPSTRTCPTISSCASRWRAIIMAAGAGPMYARLVAPPALLPCRVGSGSTRRTTTPDHPGHDRHARPGGPRSHARLRPMPRPQVRPHLRPGLLRALRHLREHAVSLRRLGAEAEHADRWLRSGPRAGRRLDETHSHRLETVAGGRPSRITIETLDEMDGDFELQKPSAGGSLGCLSLPGSSRAGRT